MGIIVFGSCVEPGGMELDDDSYEITCPKCASPYACYRRWETLDGGAINPHWRIQCPDCGHEDSDPFADDGS